jgi:hypothetical protein
MPGTSNITQPISARVPNGIAAEIRHEAESRGLTVSDVVSSFIRQALGRDQREASADDR